MWLKKSRTRELLRALAPTVAGDVVDDRLEGTYQGYQVEASLRRGYPIQTGGSAEWSGPAPKDVDMFWVTLAGLAGASRWHCQSDSWVGSRPKGFAFTNVDVRSELAQGAWMGLVKRLGVPITIGESDEALQARLVDAGLFDELGALRWGKHPYLPKVEFTPPGPEWLRGWLQSSGPAGAPPEFAERLQAHGLNLEEVMKQQMAQVEQKGPGRLTVWVEAGKERVPTPERFGELLDHAVRIAQINQQVNPASK